MRCRAGVPQVSLVSLILWTVFRDSQAMQVRYYCRKDNNHHPVECTAEYRVSGGYPCCYMYVGTTRKSVCGSTWTSCPAGATHYASYTFRYDPSNYQPTTTGLPGSGSTTILISSGVLIGTLLVMIAIGCYCNQKAQRRALAVDPPATVSERIEARDNAAYVNDEPPPYTSISFGLSQRGPVSPPSYSEAIQHAKNSFGQTRGDNSHNDDIPDTPCSQTSSQAVTCSLSAQD